MANKWGFRLFLGSTKFIDPSSLINDRLSSYHSYYISKDNFSQVQRT